MNRPVRGVTTDCELTSPAPSLCDHQMSIAEWDSTKCLNSCLSMWVSPSPPNISCSSSSISSGSMPVGSLDSSARNSVNVTNPDLSWSSMSNMESQSSSRGICSSASSDTSDAITVRNSSSEIEPELSASISLSSCCASASVTFWPIEWSSPFSSNVSMLLSLVVSKSLNASSSSFFWWGYLLSTSIASSCSRCISSAVCCGCPSSAPDTVLYLSLRTWRACACNDVSSLSSRSERLSFCWRNVLFTSSSFFIMPIDCVVMSSGSSGSSRYIAISTESSAATIIIGPSTPGC
mmetsp:Transcript_2259/g.5829  ORF Transcript_2259/g.5829 Transcript_2259/m.5829 type:complete len:292 (-) Transcript_2259:88-963(-)